MSNRPVCLVGLPGAGKSVVGKTLAKRLGVQFFDSDEEVERRLSCTIRQFFEVEGEARFRELEGAVLRSLCAAETGGCVISTGGGAVLLEANRVLLKQHATVVYLSASPSELARRLRNDTKRPLLQGGNLSEKLADLFAVRDRLYREVASFIIETGRPSVQGLVNMILMQLELAGIVDPAQVPSLVDPAGPVEGPSS